MNTKIAGGIAAGVAIAIIAAIASMDLEVPIPEPSIQTNEKLGLVINTPYIQTTLDDVNLAFEQAGSSGVGRSNVYMFWNMIEPQAGQYDFKQTDLLMSFHKTHDQKVTLYFSIINGKTLGPFPDWVGTPELNKIPKERLIKTLDEILSRYFIIDTLIISGETDEHFRYNEEGIDEYKEIFNEIYDELKAKHPDVKIGNAFSLHGVINKQLENIVQELDVGDFVAFTYFPIDSLAYISRTPSEGVDDLQKALELSPNNKVAFFEVSWSTSDAADGNEHDQSQFIKQAYEFFDENESEIEFFTWYRLYDRPHGSCRVDPEQFEGTLNIGGASGLGGSELVIERLGHFTCNAGLLDVNGNAKQGWKQFRSTINSLT